MDRLVALLRASSWVDRPIASLELVPRGAATPGSFDLRIEYESQQRWLDGRNPTRALVKAGGGPIAIEARVYQELLPRRGLVAPRCYGIDCGPDGAALLLLEAPPPDTPRTSALDRVRTAVDRLARLHAAFWNDRRLRDAAWLDQSEVTSFTLVHGGLGRGAALDDLGYARVRRWYR